MATTLGVKVEDETRERLKLLAEQKDRSTHWIIRKAIEQYLVREEAFERERREDQLRWENYQLSGSAASNEAVVDWLDQLAVGHRAPWPT